MKLQPQLKVYIDRLKDDSVEKIDFELPPEFLEVNDEALSFLEPIFLKGSAYLASDHLVIQLKIETQAQIPCTICNEKVTVPIIVDNLKLTVETSSIRSAIFDYSSEVRDAVLLKCPAFIECNSGHCPDRSTIEKYLKT